MIARTQSISNKVNARAEAASRRMEHRQIPGPLVTDRPRTVIGRIEMIAFEHLSPWPL